MLRASCYAPSLYALLIHLAWSWWTWRLVQDLSGAHWQRHLGELVTWTLVVLVASPVALGLPLNRLLRKAESGGSLSWWHYALGGCDARDAWELVFQRATTYGAWVLFHLKGDSRLDPPGLVLGKYGKHSMAGQSPAEHDLFLQEMWAIDQLGYPVTELHPRRGM